MLVEGPSDGKKLPLLAQASVREASDVKPKKTDVIVERKVLAYPPPHYFDTHKVITQLQQAGRTCLIMVNKLHVLTVSVFVLFRLQQ